MIIRRTGRSRAIKLSRRQLPAAIVSFSLAGGLNRGGNAADRADAPSAGDMVAGIYDLVSSPGGKLPDWEKVRRCFLKEAVKAGNRACALEPGGRLVEAPGHELTGVHGRGRETGGKP